MKKYLKILLISILLLPIMVNAASGKITVSSTSTVVVGNKVTVTVNLTGSDIGSWEMTLNYDKSYLQLTNSSAEAGGTVMVNSSSKAITSKKYTFTFKTLKKGNTTVSVKGYEAYAFSDMQEINLTSSGKTIKIITQDELEASYSKDNNLKSLSVEGYELDKPFAKDTLNYSVTVPEGTKSVKINAQENDSKASVSGDGDVNVTEGANTFKIVVRAENGSEKTYTLVVNVIDQNPINVTINDLNYTVIKLRDNYECPDAFNESSVTINDLEIPSCYNENLNYQLVGLKLEDGTIENYIYNNGKYDKYNEIIGTSLKLIILDYNGNIEGLEKTTLEINENKYPVFKTSNSHNYVVYGINVETGKKDFYNYDTINKTFTLYDNSNLKDVLQLNKMYLYIIIAFAACLFFAIICVISLLNNKKKIQRLLKETKRKMDELQEERLREEEEKQKEEVKEVKKPKKKKKSNKKVEKDSDENHEDE